MAMQQETFCALRELAEKHTGQYLDQSKGLLLANRLTGLAYRTGHETVDELVRNVGNYRRGSNLGLQIATALLDCRSRFMSERIELRPLVGTVIAPALARTLPVRYRIWCAGCGSGQEAYSLQIMLNNTLPADMAGRIDLVATDISDTVLMRANNGLFGHFEVQLGLSAQNLLRHFSRRSEHAWQISPELNPTIRFEAHNLLSGETGPGRFDLIICRNVLGSMTSMSRERAERNLRHHLNPGGYIHLIA